MYIVLLCNALTQYSVRKVVNKIKQSIPEQDNRITILIPTVLNPEWSLANILIGTMKVLELNNNS